MTQAQHEMIKAAPLPGVEQTAILEMTCSPGVCVYDELRQSILSIYELQDCRDIADLERMIASSPSYGIYRNNKRYARSKDGR